MCLARGVVGGERIRLLGLDVTNYMGTRGVLDACMCLSCGGVWCRWGLGRELGPGSGRLGWCYVCVNCESGFFVYMAGPGVFILC